MLVKGAIVRNSVPCCQIGSAVHKVDIKGGTNHYTPVCLWDVITCPCPGYMRLAHHF